VLAAEHINGRGGMSGRPVRMTILDGGFDSEVVLQSLSQLAGQALKSDHTTKGGQLKLAILGSNPYQGLQGEFLLDHFRDVKRPLFLLTGAHGKLAVKD